MPPARVDLERIDRRPALERAPGCLDARLLAHFASRGIGERLVHPIDRAGDRLPEARAGSALEKQHLQRGGMDHHQHRDRKLGSHASRNRSWSSRRRSGSTKTAKKTLPFPAQNSVLESSASSSTPRSSGASSCQSENSRWPARSDRLSSSASQFWPNQSGSCSVRAMRSSSSALLFTPAREILGMAGSVSRTSRSWLTRYTPEREASFNRSASLPISRG